MDENLINHYNKCRFCLGRIKSTRIAVQITEEIEQSFFNLTNTKLKTSGNYSSAICKTCLKDLESSVGFQQKVIVNQQRLERFEFEDAGSVNQEEVEPEDLKTVEIKTECFDFELPSVVQSWQEPPEDEVKIYQDRAESPTVADSDDDSHKDDSSVSLDRNLIEETTEHEEKPQNVPETSKTRICPYCAGEFAIGGIKTHIERHQNKINNTPLKCQFCEQKFYCQSSITAHVKSKHPEKYRSKARKAKGVICSTMERRKIILDAHLANPSMTYSYLARKFKLPETTVRRLLKRYKETKTIDRAPKSGGVRSGNREMYDKIERSFSNNPEWSDRLRAAKLGTSHTVVGRVRKRVGFQRDVHESTRIYQCPQCPSKYSHNTTLTTHIDDKHMNPTRVYQCQQCPLKYSRNKSLIAHSKEKH